VGKLDIDAAGNLYGTASSGGPIGTCGGSGCGVVFELVKPKISGQSWAERVLYKFGAVANDGIAPSPDLLFRGGLLYGTTEAGGTHKFGTVFQLTPHTGLWTETILQGWQAPGAPLHEYPAGTAGPAAGTALIERDGRRWHYEAGS